MSELQYTHFADLLEDLSSRQPHHMFLVDRGRHVTYGEFRQRVRDVARGLFAFGVRPGNRVAVLLPNRVEWFDIAFGAFELGATVVPLSTWYRTWDLEYCLRHCEAQVLVTMREFRGNRYLDYLSELAPELATADRRHLELPSFPTLRRVVTIDGRASAAVWTLGELRAAGRAVTDGQVLECRRQAESQDLAYILYTSGTTSAPKGVMVEHGACVQNGFYIGERQHMTARDRVWLAVSLSWGLASENALPAIMTHGGSMVLQESFDAREALRLFEEEGVTVLYGMPNMIRALTADPSRSTRDCRSLRTGVMIGNPSDVRHAAREMGVASICNVYGSTETYGNCCVTDADDPLEVRANCQGRPLPGMEVRVVDPVSRDVMEPGQTGDVCVGGRVVPGYWNDPALTGEAFVDGYYLTGDRGYLDADGRMHFVGRIKDMIKTGGINVAPAEVEDFLMCHPAVREAFVLGVPDPVKSQVVVGILRLDADCSLTAAELIAFCRTRIATYKIPERLYFVTEREVPRTATGKVNKVALLAMVERWASSHDEPPAGIGS